MYLDPSDEGIHRLIERNLTGPVVMLNLLRFRPSADYAADPHLAARIQHFAQASMRAIEEGRYLVRSANTGISGIVDPYGRIVSASPIFERTVVSGEVRFLSEQTVYGQTGDAFAWSCVLATLLAVALMWGRSPATRGSR